MPLSLAETGQQHIIKRVGGSAEVRQHLENLGFTPGCSVTVVSELGGNLIIKVMESRVALSKELAAKIIV